MAKLNAKYGFRKNNNSMDWNRFLMSQQSALDDNFSQNPQDLEKYLSEKIDQNFESEKKE